MTHRINHHASAEDGAGHVRACELPCSLLPTSPRCRAYWRALSRHVQACHTGRGRGLYCYWPPCAGSTEREGRTVVALRCGGWPRLHCASRQVSPHRLLPRRPPSHNGRSSHGVGLEPETGEREERGEGESRLRAVHGVPVVRLVPARVAVSSHVTICSRRCSMALESGVFPSWLRSEKESPCTSARARQTCHMHMSMCICPCACPCARDMCACTRACPFARPCACTCAPRRGRDRPASK